MKSINHDPLLHLLNDAAVTEIMVNSFDQIFVEQEGRILLSSVRFQSEAHLEDYIQEMIVHKQGAQQYFYDGVLENGYRFNVVLPPMNPKGASLTIRKFSDKKYDLGTLVQKGTLTAKAAYFLSGLVRAKTNLVVSGGTGSGKTTFLQALSSEIPANERIVTIEDVPELRLHQKNWIQLVSVHDTNSPVTIRDCLVNSLRMRPDRIIVGECRRDETFDMLQAMNTGHEGSMTTIHANTPNDCLTRMENLLRINGFDIPIKALRRQMVDTIQFIIQLKRSTHGRRIVSEIIEITGMETDIITRAPVFELNSKGVLSTTGYVPKLIHELQEKSFPLPLGFFNADFKWDKVS